MRIVTGILCVLMLLFVAVQYNDPDGLFWMAVYGSGAFWAGVACLKPHLLDHVVAKSLLLANFAAACAGTIYFWPKSKGWWRIDVWWNTETAREGMGMMVLVVVFVVVLYCDRKRKSVVSQ